MDIKNNKRIIVRILSLFLLVLVLIAGTFAYIRWSSDEDSRTKVMFSTGSNFKCSADGGGEFTADEVYDEDTDFLADFVLMPISSCLNEDYVYKKTIIVTPEILKSDVSINGFMVRYTCIIRFFYQ